MKGNFLYKRLGNIIARSRKKNAYSQEQLAFKCNMDRTYLARIEEGKANPSVKILYKISRQLNIKLSDLLIDL